MRIVSCPLPVKAPWHNRIEAKWMRGKRAIVEPDRELGGDEVIERVCHYHDCERLERFSQHVT